MNFTREDLQRIAKGLKQLSIKDTQFANATALTTETKFPVVQGNVNVLLTAAQLLNFLVSNLDANSLKVNIPNWTSGTLSNLLGRLYTLAVSPRDADGNPITAETIEYSNTVDEEITSVATALDYVIDQLLNKIDAIELSGEPHLDSTQMPIITLRNIIPTDTCPVTTGSGMWFDENHILQYRDGNAIPPVDVEIGEPVDMLYYYDGNAYKYNTSTQAFVKVGAVDLSSYIKKDSFTERLGYDMMPWVVLTSMTTPNAQVLNTRKDFCYYNPYNRKVTFHKSDLSTSSYNPQEGVIYYDVSSGSFLIWNGGDTNPWTVVGGTSQASNKADILTGTTMLAPAEWPKVVINNIGPYDTNEDEAGDVIYDYAHEKLVLFNGYDDNLEPVYVDMGRPQEGTVYCLKSTNALYRWENDDLQWIPVTSGGEGGGINATIEGTSIVLNGNSGGSSGGETPAPYVISGSGVFVVDLSLYGITKGYMNKESGHYTSSQYEKMYKNATGFTRAFSDAYANGYSKVVIPKGEYCFTPIFNVGHSAVTLYNTPPAIWILNMSGLDIDMNGSTFHLLVDSSEHSSYYNSNSSSYDYKCTLIGIGQSKNITIRNGNFRGDWYSRSFTNSNEKKQESCCGITVGISGFTYNVNLINLDGSGFSGDFIISWSKTVRLYKQPFWDKLLDTGGHADMVVAPGTTIDGVMNYGHYFTFDGSSAVVKKYNDSSNKYGLSGVHDLGNWFSGSSYSSYEYVCSEAARREYSITSMGGMIRMGNCYCPMINVLTYATEPDNAEVLPLRIIKTGYYDSFQLFNNERYVRLQFLHEDGLATGSARYTADSGFDAKDYFGVTPNTVPADQTTDCDAGGEGPRIVIVPKVNGMVLIEGCHIHDNGRGGISGGSNDVVIRHCEFMKQQYNATSAEQGAYPVFTQDSTNYHIDYEDSVANHVTIENCLFYSGKSTGKLLFPTILRLDFRNNICFGCIPVVGNNLLTNISGNTFHGTGLASVYDNWLSGDSSSQSKLKMMRVMNYTNNNYHKCAAPSYSSLSNTVQNINNCYIEIDDSEGTQFDELAVKDSLNLFITGVEQNRIFSGCKIKFLTKNTRAYFSYLKDCSIEGGNAWYVSRIEDCKLADSSFKILHNLNNTDGTSADIYIKNVSGLNLRCRCMPFLTNTLTSIDYSESAHDYIVHYENCEIDVSNASSELFSYAGGSARTYNDIKLEFNNCRFTGTAPTTNFDSNTSSHKAYADFNNCLFELSSSKLFAGTVSSAYRYFEFTDCKFNTSSFKLSNDVDVICGGESGTTTNRPKLTKHGSMYYDTTLNKPVWRKTELQQLSSVSSSSVEFVDATGTTV